MYSELPLVWNVCWCVYIDLSVYHRIKISKQSQQMILKNIRNRSVKGSKHFDQTAEPTLLKQTQNKTSELSEVWVATAEKSGSSNK